jgi:Tfp pilus assembly protein PilO
MKGSIRILVTAAGLLAVIGVAVLVVIMPIRQREAEDRAVVEQRRDELVKLQVVTARINDLKSEIERLEKSLKTFEGRLPDARKCDEVLGEVWKIAETNSLVPRSVRTSPVETATRYSFQPVALSMEGKFNSFYEFLQGLERMPRLAKVRQLMIAKTPRTEGIVQADLLVDIFFEKKQ